VVSFKSEVASTGREAVKNMLEIATDSPSIFGRSAAVEIPDSFRSDAFRNYSAQLNALKGNIIPAALTAMREASTTGGALGQVSERELALLESALGALDPGQSPENFRANLTKIKSSVKRFQNAVQAQAGGGDAGDGLSDDEAWKVYQQSKQ